jgi:membrane protein
MWLLAPFRLTYRVARRFHTDRCAQTAAALSFATLLALVPMISVAIALLSQFPFASGIGDSLERFLLANLLPDKAGAIIAKYLGLFANRVGRVTLIGIGALALTALMQMLTIEHAFDTIWGVKLRRPLWRRIVFHLLALLLGPLVFGASLFLMTYVVTASLGYINEPAWVSAFVGKGMSFVLTTILFAFIYWGVPNKAISRWHALFGGAAAALGFVGLQSLFAMYVTKFSAYAILYGGFAAIPVFLIWIYASWGVILIGALMVAEMPRAGKPSSQLGKNHSSKSLAS